MHFGLTVALPCAQLCFQHLAVGTQKSCLIIPSSDVDLELLLPLPPHYTGCVTEAAAEPPVSFHLTSQRKKTTHQDAATLPPSTHAARASYLTLPGVCRSEVRNVTALTNPVVSGTTAATQLTFPLKVHTHTLRSRRTRTHDQVCCTGGSCAVLIHFHGDFSLWVCQLCQIVFPQPSDKRG